MPGQFLTSAWPVLTGQRARITSRSTRRRSAKIEEEARYDGNWVLRTNTDLDTAEVALQFKRLWMVEAWFRSCKSLLLTRPVCHKCEETIQAHVFCSFLALVMRQELQARLAKDGHDFEWADVIQASAQSPHRAHQAGEFMGR